MHKNYRECFSDSKDIKMLDSSKIQSLASTSPSYDDMLGKSSEAKISFQIVIISKGIDNLSYLLL